MEAADQQLDNIRKQAGEAIAQKYRIIVRDRTALMTTHMTAWDLLDDSPSPYLDDWRMPFSPFIPFQDTDDLYSIKGVIRDLKDAQREINWDHSTIQDELVRGAKSGWWIPKDMEAQVEDLRQRIHRAAPPIPVVPAQMSQGFMSMMQFSEQAIMKISGINAELAGTTTQKTVSGRAIQARQAGGLVGVSSLMLRWNMTQEYTFTLLLKRIMQYYSEQKMLRILGQDNKMSQEMGMSGQMPPAEILLERFKYMKQIDYDIKIGFQEASATARQAVFTQAVQLKALGVPYSLDMLVDMSDAPRKEEVKAILKQSGPEPVNPDIAKIIGAAQGSGGKNPDGVNLS
jgi:hypothetical protein